MNKIKSLETSLVLTTGFVLIYFITSNIILLYLAFSFGIIGIFVKPIAKYIAIAWFKLGDILNFVVSKIILGSIFFLVLVPISLLYRLSKNDKLKIKKPQKSNWVQRDYTYKSADLKNIW